MPTRAEQYAMLARNPKTYAMHLIPIPDRTVAALNEFNAALDGSPYLFMSLERLGHINAKKAQGDVARSRRDVQQRAAGFSEDPAKRRVAA